MTHAPYADRMLVSRRGISRRMVGRDDVLAELRQLLDVEALPIEMLRSANE